MLPQELLGKVVLCATELVTFNTTVRINNQNMTIVIATNQDNFGECAYRQGAAAMGSSHPGRP